MKSLLKMLEDFLKRYPSFSEGYETEEISYLLHEALDVVSGVVSGAYKVEGYNLSSKARLTFLYAAHKLVSESAGVTISTSVGDESETVKAPDGDSYWESTKYGREYLRLISINNLAVIGYVE
jgi:hypothetical protein